MSKRALPNEDDPTPVDENGVPSSGPRLKAPTSKRRELNVARLTMATDDVHGAELDAAVDEWIEHTIERQAKAAPNALREELRETMRALVKNDPAVSAMVRALRR
jgi:hypothetical protein